MMTNKFAYVFPGQGSQQIGMGQDVANTYPEAAAIFAEADQILDFPLSQLCWTGSETDLNDTYNTQPALFVTSLAVLAALQAAGYTREPACLAGHSLGEYAAYVAAGVLSFEDGLILVRKRGQLMKKAGEINPGKMAAILALDDDRVADICRQASAEVDWVQVANYNCPGQIVISGSEAGIDRAIELAKSAGARRAQKLAVSIAAHSKLMAVIQAEFSAAVETVSLGPPAIPLIANNTAQPLKTIADIKTEMVDQLTSSLLWTGSIQTMCHQGITHFIEVGSKNVLSGMIKRIDRKAARTVIENSADINKLMQAEAG